LTSIWPCWGCSRPAPRTCRSIPSIRMSASSTFALRDHRDAIHLLHARKAMSDENDRAVAHDALQGATRSYLGRNGGKQEGFAHLELHLPKARPFVYSAHRPSCCSRLRSACRVRRGANRAFEPAGTWLPRERRRGCSGLAGRIGVAARRWYCRSTTRRRALASHVHGCRRDTRERCHSSNRERTGCD
jgi:hypothetical protein